MLSRKQNKINNAIAAAAAPPPSSSSPSYRADTTMDLIRSTTSSEINCCCCSNCCCCRSHQSVPRDDSNTDLLLLFDEEEWDGSTIHSGENNSNNYSSSECISTQTNGNRNNVNSQRQQQQQQPRKANDENEDTNKGGAITFQNLREDQDCISNLIHKSYQRSGNGGGQNTIMEGGRVTHHHRLHPKNNSGKLVCFPYYSSARRQHRSLSKDPPPLSTKSIKRGHTSSISSSIIVPSKSSSSSTTTTTMHDYYYLTNDSITTTNPIILCDDNSNSSTTNTTSHNSVGSFTKKNISSLYSSWKSTSSSTTSTNNNNNSSTSGSTTCTGNRMISKKDKKKKTKATTREEMAIYEARQRAQMRLQPPPMTNESKLRLQELKEAKSKWKRHSTTSTTIPTSSSTATTTTATTTTTTPITTTTSTTPPSSCTRKNCCCRTCSSDRCCCYNSLSSRDSRNEKRAIPCRRYCDNGTSISTYTNQDEGVGEKEEKMRENGCRHHHAFKDNATATITTFDHVNNPLENATMKPATPSSPTSFLNLWRGRQCNVSYCSQSPAVGEKNYSATSTSHQTRKWSMTSLAKRHWFLFVGMTILQVIMNIAAHRYSSYHPISTTTTTTSCSSRSSSSCIRQHPQAQLLFSLVRIILTSISLRYLLTSSVLYSLENIGGPVLFILVRNMRYAKQMIVTKVLNYSSGIAIVMAGISILMAGGMSFSFSMKFMNNFVANHSSTSSTNEGAAAEEEIDTNEEEGVWHIRANEISIFLSLRLGLFVFASLLLGHIFLPSTTKRTMMDNNDDVKTIRSTPVANMNLSYKSKERMKVVIEEDDEEEEEGEIELLEQPKENMESCTTNGCGPRNRQSDRHLGCHDNNHDKKNKKKVGARSWSATFLLAVVALITTTAKASSSSMDLPTVSKLPSRSTDTQSQTNNNEKKTVRSILIAGSMNADTFLPVHRLPSPGETLTLLRNQHPMVDVPGGKGCNQAVACARLLPLRNHEGRTGVNVSFLGQFGNDSASVMLRDALITNGVDVSLSGQSNEHPSGRGYVLLVPETGEVSAVVSGGSNMYGWDRWGVTGTDDSSHRKSSVYDGNSHNILSDQDIEDIVSSNSLLLLQCEIPNLVNLRLARAARKYNVPVLLDVGGEDRKMERELLEYCDYLIPNETELERLANSFHDDVNVDDPAGGLPCGMTKQEMESIQAQIGSSLDLSTLMKSVRILQRNGANNLLITLGSHGSMLIRKDRGKTPPPGRRPLIYLPACALPVGTTVVDETGAGDCYRAGFATALLENCIGETLNGEDDEIDDEVLAQCMKFASAVGALAVTRKGAVPSIPSRMEVEELLLLSEKRNNTCEMASHNNILPPTESVPRGGHEDDFPFLFGSRINSMKDRPDLVDSSTLPLCTPHDYLRRMATIRGLGCVDFNFPQHFDGYWTPKEAKKALDEVNLVAGAVCLRYPSKFARGAMNHPDKEMRNEAIEITKRAADAARVLGCNEVVVWSAYDGYDYPFQVNYREKWDQIIQAFRECCDAYPDIKWSLEFKPTDENTRFFTVPSTGAAMLLVHEIDRPNMGLTLDMGHMLMAGENPGQSIALVGDKLFGIQLNDGYTRLAAEDGMMFGSIHPSIALETMHQLRLNNFKGHLYFDTFPQRTDPVKEAEYNIRRVKEFWSAVTKMDRTEIEKIAREHDAIGALELVNEALRR